MKILFNRYTVGAALVVSLMASCNGAATKPEADTTEPTPPEITQVDPVDLDPTPAPEGTITGDNSISFAVPRATDPSQLATEPTLLDDEPTPAEKAVATEVVGIYPELQTLPSDDLYAVVVPWWRDDIKRADVVAPVELPANIYNLLPGHGQAMADRAAAQYRATRDAETARLKAEELRAEAAGQRAQAHADSVSTVTNPGLTEYTAPDGTLWFVNCGSGAARTETGNFGLNPEITDAHCGSGTYSAARQAQQAEDAAFAEVMGAELDRQGITAEEYLFGQ